MKTDKGLNDLSHAYAGELSSLSSQEHKKLLKSGEELAARVGDEPSPMLADARTESDGEPKKRQKSGGEAPDGRLPALQAAALKRLAALADAPASPKRKGKAKGKGKTAEQARATERVPLGGARRYVDMIEMMYRRRQIDARQHMAANRYREAAEAASGGMPCALDMSRVRGGSGPGSPTEAQLWGAGVLQRAQHILGQTDGAIITLAVVEGLGVHEIAGRMFRRDEAGRVRRGDAEHVGRRLREALSTLADAWWPAQREGRIRAVRDPDAVQVAYPISGSIEPGVVAHARPGRVRFTDPAKREKGD